MTTGDNQAQSVRKMAWRGLRKYFNAIMTVASVTVLLRIGAFIPLLLGVDFGGKLPVWMSYSLAAAAYIAGAIPMRFWGREKMRRMFYSRHLNHSRKGTYQKWLEAGLVRYARGILWGLPFLAGVVYFTVVRSRMDAKTFWMPVRWLAVLVGQEANLGAGLIVAMGLMAIFGLLFAYGWWRDEPVEYLPVRSIGTKKTFHWSRRIRKNYSKEMRKNTLVNFVLSLPAWIGMGAVLVPYALENVDFSTSTEVMFSQLLHLLRARLPFKVRMLFFAVLLVLYVPFWIFRKTRNAALMGQLMRANDHSSGKGSSGHKSSESLTPPVTPKRVDFHPSMGSGTSATRQPLPTGMGARPAETSTPPAAASPQPAEKPAEPREAQIAERADGDKNLAQDAAKMAQEAARIAQEAAENAVRLAQEAARIAQEAAKNKQE